MINGPVRCSSQSIDRQLQHNLRSLGTVCIVSLSVIHCTMSEFDAFARAEGANQQHNRLTSSVYLWTNSITEHRHTLGDILTSGTCSSTDREIAKRKTVAHACTVTLICLCVVCVDLFACSSCRSGSRVQRECEPSVSLQFDWIDWLSHSALNQRHQMSLSVCLSLYLCSINYNAPFVWFLSLLRFPPLFVCERSHTTCGTHGLEYKSSYL